MSSREIEQAGRDQLARLGTSLPASMRRALKDPKVRDALNQTYVHGARALKELRGLDRQELGGRLARDEDVHGDLTAMIRSAARVVDRAKGSRRAAFRRRATWVVTVLGIAVAGVALRARRASQALVGNPLPDISNHETPASDAAQDIEPSQVTIG